MYRCNFSPGSCNNFACPSMPSPTSPSVFGGRSTSSSSYLRPRTDSQSTDPQLVFSPNDCAAEIARHFAFLNAQNSPPGISFLPQMSEKGHYQRLPKSSHGGSLVSYKSAPELFEQDDCSGPRRSTLEGRHTVSREYILNHLGKKKRRRIGFFISEQFTLGGSAFETGGNAVDHKPSTSSTSAANGSVNTPKRHRIGLSALFHTSRSKHSSSSGKPSSPAGEGIPISPLPSTILLDFSSCSNVATSTTAAAAAASSSVLPPAPPSTASSVASASQVGRSSNKRKPSQTTPRRLFHKVLQPERSRQRRTSGSSRNSSGITKKQCDSTSPDSSTIPPHDSVSSNSGAEVAQTS